MSSDASRIDRATSEAAQWFSKLNDTSVSSATLEAFYAWRKTPDNDAAYRGLERIWDKSGQLSADPEIRLALAGARSRATAAKSRGAVHWGLGLATAAVLICVGMIAYTGITSENPHVFTTAVGEQRALTLADGSRVRLDTDSQIAVHFRHGLRSVALNRGQAMFDVIHRADQPFEVTVGHTVIRDLGTRFDVRKESATVRVTLIEGALQVAGADQRQPVWTLKPGQQIITGGQAPTAQTVDASSSTSWTTGRLVFEDLALDDATAEINRYATHKIILADSAVGTIKVTGTFDTNDPDAFASAVAKLYDLALHRTADGGILLDHAADSDSAKKT